MSSRYCRVFQRDSKLIIRNDFTTVKYNTRLVFILMFEYLIKPSDFRTGNTVGGHCTNSHFKCLAGSSQLYHRYGCPWSRTVHHFRFTSVLTYHYFIIPSINIIIIHGSPWVFAVFSFPDQFDCFIIISRMIHLHLITVCYNSRFYRIECLGRINNWKFSYIHGIFLIRILYGYSQASNYISIINSPVTQFPGSSRPFARFCRRNNYWFKLIFRSLQAICQLHFGIRSFFNFINQSRFFRTFHRKLSLKQANIRFSSLATKFQAVSSHISLIIRKITFYRISRYVSVIVYYPPSPSRHKVLHTQIIPLEITEFLPFFIVTKPVTQAKISDKRQFIQSTLRNNLCSYTIKFLHIGIRKVSSRRDIFRGIFRITVTTAEEHFQFLRIHLRLNLRSRSLIRTVIENIILAMFTPGTDRNFVLHDRFPAIA